MCHVLTFVNAGNHILHPKPPGRKKNNTHTLIAKIRHKSSAVLIDHQHLEHNAWRAVTTRLPYVRSCCSLSPTQLMVFLASVGAVTGPADVIITTSLYTQTLSSPVRAGQGLYSHSFFFELVLCPWRGLFSFEEDALTDLQASLRSSSRHSPGCPLAGPGMQSSRAATADIVREHTGQQCVGSSCGAVPACITILGDAQQEQARGQRGHKTDRLNHLVTPNKKRHQFLVDSNGS
jgi:hypothetical protein